MASVQQKIIMHTPLNNITSLAEHEDVGGKIAKLLAEHEDLWLNNTKYWLNSTSILLHKTHLHVCAIYCVVISIHFLAGSLMYSILF